MKRRTVRRTRAIIYTMIVLIMLLTVSHIESHYKRVARVDSISDNVVTFTDVLGYVWAAEDVENVVEGQTVTLKMYTRHTNGNVLDDVIVGIKPTAIRMK